MQQRSAINYHPKQSIVRSQPSIVRSQPSIVRRSQLPNHRALTKSAPKFRHDDRRIAGIIVDIVNTWNSLFFAKLLRTKVICRKLFITILLSSLTDSNFKFLNLCKVCILFKLPHWFEKIKNSRSISSKTTIKNNTGL